VTPQEQIYPGGNQVIMEIQHPAIDKRVASMSVVASPLRTLVDSNDETVLMRHVFPSGMFLPIHEDAPEGDNTNATREIRTD
jgi:hypothetical protein